MSSEKEEEENSQQQQHERAKKYNFHHTTVSVPIPIPTLPGEICYGSIPFKGPIIHEDPAKTDPDVLLSSFNKKDSPLYTDNLQNSGFFRCDGRVIQPCFANGEPCMDFGDLMEIDDEEK